MPVTTHGNLGNAVAVLAVGENVKEKENVEEKENVKEQNGNGRVSFIDRNQVHSPRIISEV